MKFSSISVEQEFQKSIWKENKTLIRIFAFSGILHTAYVFVTTFTAEDGGRNLSTYAKTALYGIQTSVPMTVFIMSLGNPLKYRLRRAIWFILLSFFSVMLSLILSTKTILCIYKIDPPETCTASARPLASANLSVIYILLGPFLILTVMRNSLRYEFVAVVVSVSLVFFTFIKTQPLNVANLLGILILIGSQVMGFLVSRNREFVERNRFLSELTNIRLSNDLRGQVIEKTLAQKKAAEEENRRTQFTSVLFHEMRVPLNSVILSMNDLEADDTLKNNLHPETVENLESINTGLNSILSIINDSLDFRKMNEGKLEITKKPFDFMKMLNSLIRSMKPNWESKHIVFVQDIDPIFLNIQNKVVSDENRLRQVMANYLSNASKFTPEYGTITLSIQTESQEYSGDFLLKVKVTDTGVGISEENQKRLFQPFVQIEPEKYQGGKGSGLGLSICASIISNMQGEYGLESELGKGSTFWFNLPMKISSALIDDKKMITVPIHNSSLNYNILITDDDRTTRRVMRRLLERLGHTVEEAENGKQCVDMMKSNHYDILFIDNQMPIMGGAEAIRHIRQRDKRTPIISLTGSSDLAQLKELKAIGASTVIVKPAKLDQIVDILKEFIEKHVDGV